MHTMWISKRGVCLYTQVCGMIPLALFCVCTYLEEKLSWWWKFLHTILSFYNYIADLICAHNGTTFNFLSALAYWYKEEIKEVALV